MMAKVSPKDSLDLKPIARSDAKIRDHFQGLYGRVLSDEEARQASENLVGFFALLQEWKAKEAKDGGRK